MVEVSRNRVEMLNKLPRRFWKVHAGQTIFFRFYHKTVVTLYSHTDFGIVVDFAETYKKEHPEADTLVYPAPTKEDLAPDPTGDRGGILEWESGHGGKVIW